ncbi:hypothetical protein JCM8547_006656 [Rhodosporidiobolus lusitaniae]
MDAAALKSIQDDVLGPVVIGAFLSFAACGINTSLFVSYASIFGRKDRLIFQVLVAALAVLTFYDTAASGAWIYEWAVDAQFDPTILSAMPWHLTSFCLCTGISVFLTQLFFTWRVYVVASRNVLSIPLAVLLAAFALAGLACMLRMAAFTLTHDLIGEYQQMRDYMWAWCGLMIAEDILITSSMWYFIAYKPRKGGNKETSLAGSPLRTIVRRAIQTNGLSLIQQVLIIVLVASSPSTLRYGTLAFCESRVYVGSLVATLNARHISPDSLDFDFSSHGYAHHSHKFSAHAGAGARIDLSSSNRAHLASMQVRVNRDIDVSVETHGGAGSEVWQAKEDGERERYAVRFDAAADVEKGSLGESV